MKNVESMGERIIRARAALNMTQLELAQRVGAAATQFSRYESGKNKPRPTMVFKIAEALGVSPEWLESGSGGSMGTYERAIPENADGNDSPIGYPERSLEEELIAARQDFNDRRLANESAGTVQVRLPKWVREHLLSKATARSTTIEAEIVERLIFSVDKDKIEDENPLPPRVLPPDAVIDHGVQVWAERLVQPNNRRELEGILAAIRAMLKQAM